MELLEYLTLKLQRYILSVPLLQPNSVYFSYSEVKEDTKDHFFRKKEAGA